MSTEDLAMNIFLSLIFMGFEIFILLKWLDIRQTRKEQDQWEPFRALFLTSIARHYTALDTCTKSFEKALECELNNIEKDGKLSDDALARLSLIINEHKNFFQDACSDFSLNIQTAAPSLTAEAGSHCGSIFHIQDYIGRDLIRRAYDALEKLEKQTHRTKEGTEPHLHAIRSVQNLTGLMTISNNLQKRKTGFTQSVWKSEGLHYYAPDDKFCSPKEYKSLLDLEKDSAELRSIPRTTPIRTFWGDMVSPD